MRAARRVVNSVRLAVMARRERRVPFWSEERIERLQRRRLRRIVRHAWETVPYWRSAFEAAGLAPEDVREVRDLARLPTLDELEVRNRMDDLRSTAWAEAETVVVESSGGAGRHVRKRIHVDPRTALRKLAWRERDRAVVGALAGRDWGLRQLLVLPDASADWDARRWWDERVWTPRAVAERGRFAAERPFEELVERLDDVRPDVVYSYGSYAEPFFRWLEATGVEPALPAVWVYGGDGMDRAWRAPAETRGCAVLSTYQSVEAGRIGFECERREGFHLNVDLAAVRIVDDEGRDVPVGETGEVVVSNLVNEATVLFNARHGDRAALVVESCPCGRSLPLLSGLEGRKWEIIRLADGRQMGTTVLRNLHKDALEFALQVQVVHPGPGRVEWRVAPLPGVDAASAAAALGRESRRILGPGTEVTVELVDEIPAEPSGKRPFVARP